MKIQLLTSSSHLSPCKKRKNQLFMYCTFSYSELFLKKFLRLTLLNSLPPTSSWWKNSISPLWIWWGICIESLWENPYFRNNVPLETFPPFYVRLKGTYIFFISPLCSWGRYLIVKSLFMFNGTASRDCRDTFWHRWTDRFEIFQYLKRTKTISWHCHSKFHISSCLASSEKHSLTHSSFLNLKWDYLHMHWSNEWA